ncbi:galactonate dehydratase [Pseudoxanthomonas japonensis]|uniref:galactonate dehydratase n=1 Tax=Pseudoxanthomonas japonensis TaxID=69284 RepID=UPI0028651B34|nr:galactonate dehydratase [Pseudoxanthomonas japonensis]MDR7069961.1 galactonate dehydratase [Pseudoxanthomonas japonensis]
MKIVRLTTYHAAPRWLFLKVDTDEGISGWGEPVIEGRAHAVEAAVHELGDYLVGQDPARINDLWQVLYRGGFYRGGAILMSAIAGIDQALWDIKGKALGVPVYQLLGGLVRDRMKTYRWVGGDRPADIVAQIQRYQAQGFDTFKFNGTEELKLIDSPRAIDAAVAKAAAIREAMGDRVDFGIDFHGRVSAPMARVLLRELAPFKPLFVEEPVLPEQWEYYRPLSDATSIPLAAGERMYSRAEFRPVLAAGGLAILQPDLSHAGGITECVKIAAMAEAHDVALAPHCPLGPVALAACLQVDFVAHNAMLQEQSIGIHYNEGADLLDYVINQDDFRCDATGSIAALPKPGLGVEIDEARLVDANRQPPRWRNPLWRHADGSVAEW